MSRRHPTAWLVPIPREGWEGRKGGRWKRQGRKVAMGEEGRKRERRRRRGGVK